MCCSILVFSVRRLSLIDKVTDMYAAQKQHRIHSTSPEKFGTCGRGMGSDEGQGTRAASCSKAALANKKSIQKKFGLVQVI